MHVRESTIEQDLIEKLGELNISRYVRTAVAEEAIDLKAVHADLLKIEKEVVEAKNRHKQFLKESGLPLLP